MSNFQRAVKATYRSAHCRHACARSADGEAAVAAVATPTVVIAAPTVRVGSRGAVVPCALAACVHLAARASCGAVASDTPSAARKSAVEKR
jgi:hypothetical protein